MFRYELHMHTREASACAHSSVEEMIRGYVIRGFSGAVITNHFIGGNTCIDRGLPWDKLVEAYSRPWYEGQKTARALDFDLLFGVEEGYGGGKEFLVYGIGPEFLLERPFLRGAEVSVWSREVRAAGGVLIYAHPFRDRSYVAEPRKMPDMSLADGVELYNFCNRPEDNALAQEVFGGQDLILTAGTDSHHTEYDDFWGVDLPGRVRTGAELAQALKSRDFRLWLGKTE